MENLTDRRFNNLLVVKQAKGIRKSKLGGKWECLCDCGNKITLAASRIITGNVKSCGCKHFKKGNSNPRWKGYGNISGSMLYRIKRDAKRRDLAFEVDAKYLWKLFQEQNNKCIFTGELLTLPTCVDEERHYKFTASLDRIDSNKGYLVGNVQWVHKEINYMKWDKTDLDFIKWCEKVALWKIHSSKNIKTTSALLKIHLEE